MQSDFRHTTRFRIAIAGLAIVAAACGDDYDNGPSAPVRSDAKGVSFAGLLFESPIIGRVRIRSGDAALGAAQDVSDGGSADLVIMDDYILSEPIRN